MELLWLYWFIIILISGLIIVRLKKLKRRIYKYIPAIILFLLSGSFLVHARYFPKSGWDDLVNIALFMITIVPATFTLIYAIIVDIKRKR